LHGTHFGRLDPNETPEGPNCGLIKSLSLFCEITPGGDEKSVEKNLRNLGVTMQIL
jgi:DNA-directed RNA polymerase beta subunit